MLIHSVTPPHLLVEQPESPALSTRPTAYGYLEGYQTPQGFHLARVNSTDLSMYLREEFTPGSLHRDESLQKALGGNGS